MSTPLPVLDAEHPWPGLFPYSEDAHAFFNGRERETLDLLRLVRRENCCLLYGQSGLGKSSLLRAGLFPRLREEGFLPVYLRLDFRNPDLPLRDQVWALLGDALRGARIDARQPESDESLWEYFHAQDVEFWDPDNRMITPVLVLDQFEELVQASEVLSMRPLLAVFLSELGDLVEGRVPAAVTARLEQDPDAVSEIDFNARRFRVVIGFREDFLADLDDQLNAQQINVQSRLRVAKMGEEQALAAVLKTGGRLVDPEVARRIVGFVSGAARSTQARVIEIEPALLSVVCFELNNRRLAERADQISAHLLEGAQEQIIEEFYQRSLADQPVEVSVFIERELLTESGYRDSCAVEDAVSRHGISRTVIQVLVERRVLRLEERFGVLRVELTHDVLAPVVRALRDARQAERDQREAREREVARLKRTRRLMWSGGVLATIAMTLVGVFYYLFRQAESEKARVIEAQSDLFLSRANTSLEQDVPAEPFRFLARSLELNPANEGAVARLAGLGVHGSFARQQWALPLTFGGEGLASLLSLGGDRFVLVRNGNALTQVNIRAVEGGTGPVLDCIDRAGKPGSPPWQTLNMEGLKPAQPVGGAKLSAVEFNVLAGLPESIEKTEWARKCLWSPAVTKTTRQAALGIEPDGAALWMEDARGLVRIRTDGAQSESLAGAEHLRPWRRVDASIDGWAVLVTGDLGSALFLRNASSGHWNNVAELPGSGSRANRVGATFDEAGAHLLVSEPDGNCSMWRRGGQKPLWRRACDSEGHRFVPGQPWVMVRHGDRELAVLDTETAALRGRLKMPLAINHVQTSRNGERVVVSSQDSTAAVFSLPALTPLGVPMRHEGSVVEAHFLPGESRIVTAAFDGAVRVWNATTGVQELAMVHGGPVLFARPVLGGTHVLTMAGDQVLRLWRLRPEQQLVHKFGKPMLLPTPTADGARIAYVSVITSPSEAGSAGNSASAVPLHAVEIAGVRAAPSAEGMLLSPERRLTSPVPVTALAWRPGRVPDRLVIVTADSTIRLISATDGAVLKSFSVPQAVRAVALTATLTHIVCRMADDSLRIFDLATGSAAGLPVNAPGSLLDWGLSADGKYLMVAGQGGMAVHDVMTSYPLVRHKLAGVISAAVHPIQAEIAFSRSGAWGRWKPSIEEGARQAKPESASVEGTETSVLGLKVNPGADKAVAPASGLYEFATGKVLLGLRYSPTGLTLAMYSLDGKVFSVQTSTGRESPELRHSNSVSDLSFSQDGRWLATTTLDGRVRVWDHRSGQLMTETSHDPVSGARFQVVGRGTWALGTSAGLLPSGSRSSASAQLLGLGFDEAAPNWLVPTMGALAAMELTSSNDAFDRHDTKKVQAGDGGEWWTQWLSYVAAKNGIRRP